MLEIGTGWGGFALFAATRYGCQVTTTTISAEQYDVRGRLIARAGDGRGAASTCAATTTVTCGAVSTRS